MIKNPFDSSLETILNIKREIMSLGHAAIDLLIGEPDHEPPKVLIESLKMAIQFGFNKYTDQQGAMNTRSTISKFVKKENIGVGPENIFLSSGSKQITYAVIQLYANLGTKAIMFRPYYPPYFNQLLLTRIKPEVVKSEKEMIESIIHDNQIKMAIIVNPNNPDGNIYSKDFIRELTHICFDKDVVLVIDETYKNFWYKEPFESIASDINFDSTDQLVVVRSFSKSLGICGWRLGYSLSSRKIANNLKSFQSVAFNPPNTLVQFAISDSLMKIDNSYFDENRQKYGRRLDKLTRVLNNDGIKASVPSGSFYLFLDLSDYIGKNKKYDSSLNLCVELAKQKRILAWPGIDYGDDHSIRISVAHTGTSDLNNASHGIASFLND